MTELVEAGVSVRTVIGKTCHQKTWIVDDSIAFIGSGNGTSNSRNRCYEFGIETYDPDVVKKLRAKFLRLWEEGRPVTAETARRASAQRVVVRRN